MSLLNIQTAEQADVLEKLLSTRTYIELYTPTVADKECYETLKITPDPLKCPHIYRWHKHIASYKSVFSQLKTAAEIEAEAKAKAEAEAKAKAEAEAKAKAEAEDEDEDIDIMEETPEQEKEREELAKKQREAKLEMVSKPKKAAKSIVTLQVKPWEDTTDMAELEANVREIEMDGLVWGKSQLLPVGYGINLLQINLVIEDEKVSVFDLEEKIKEDEEHVQSTDVAAMQKL